MSARPFKSSDFHMRPSTMTDAFSRAFGSVKVGKRQLIREAKLMHIEPDGNRNIIHAS